MQRITGKQRSLGPRYPPQPEPANLMVARLKPPLLISKRGEEAVERGQYPRGDKELTKQRMHLGSLILCNITQGKVLPIFGLLLKVPIWLRRSSSWVTGHKLYSGTLPTLTTRTFRFCNINSYEFSFIVSLIYLLAFRCHPESCIPNSSENSIAITSLSIDCLNCAAQKQLGTN